MREPQTHFFQSRTLRAQISISIENLPLDQFAAYFFLAETTLFALFGEKKKI